jgi:RNA polymerase sigma-70 factor, ECF subfamily
MTSETNDAFSEAAAPFQRELLAYCYRMLGSVHDAEDLVQETFLRAWRSFDDFDDRRASLRTWLYRIATNVCLTALEQRGRRALPSSTGAPGHGPSPSPTVEGPEPDWLEPVPDVLLDQPEDPAAIVGSQVRVRLAFIAALQYLPARQRAVLILREVLAWRASEVADLLGTTTDAVNSALRRARAHLAQVAVVEDQILEPDDAHQRRILDQYVRAFVTADLRTLVDLLRSDVELEMPPIRHWFRGRDDVARFIGEKIGETPDIWRMVPAPANGQPAVAAYRRDESGRHQAHGVHVLTIVETGIARIVAFQDTRLFARFGLPDHLPADAPGSPSAPVPSGRPTPNAFPSGRPSPLATPSPTPLRTLPSPAPAARLPMPPAATGSA